MSLSSLFRTMLVALLLVSSASAFCCSYNRVRSAGYILYDDDNGSLVFSPAYTGIGTLLMEELNYSLETMLLVSTPMPESGYEATTSALVGRSVYQHPISYIYDDSVGDYILTGPIISVYVFANSGEWHSIYEANLVELANGANEREIKSGFTTNNPYYLWEVNYTNGDKEVYYRIPDLSNSAKRVRVVTCPNTVNTPANTSYVVCTTTFAFIKGTTDE